MCFFGTPKDDSADIARKEAIAREQRITSGRQAIDQNFAKFDDNYYKGVQDSYTGYYQPQLDDQYGDARRALTLQLSRSGNLNGSAGARQIGKLTEAYNNNQALLGDRALAAVQAAQASVATNKSDLYNQLTASADPSAAANTAIARAQSLSTPQAYSPIGDLFSSFLNTGANAIQAERAGYTGLNTGLFSPPKSTVKVVN